MSYSTHMRGRIEIAPPLNWMEIKDSKHYGGNGTTERWPEYPDLVFEIEHEDKTMPEGVLRIERAVAIVPASDLYPTRGDHADSELRAIVKEFGDRHTFEGAIEGLGQGDGTIEGIDVWRMSVGYDGTVRKIKPRLVWE